MYISKYNVNGNLQWIKSYGGTGFDLCNTIVYDGTANIYAMGRFNTSITFSSTTINGAAVNSFITKFDANGDPLWAKAIAGYEEGDLSFSNNKLAFSVSSSNGFNMSPFTLSALGGTDILIGEMDPAGNPLWAKIYGGSSNDEGSGISQFNGSVYFTGSFNSTANFDSYSFTSMASWDVVVAKLNPALSAGIKEFSNGDIDVIAFPNPATFTVNILSPVEISKIEIYDMSGKLVYSAIPGSTNYSIDLRELQNGVYFMKNYSDKNYLRTKRIIVTK
jgi:hypothetical protein